MTPTSKNHNENSGKRRRTRNIALGLSLFGLVILFYVVTVLRMGAQ